MRFDVTHISRWQSPPSAFARRPTRILAPECQVSRSPPRALRSAPDSAISRFGCGNFSRTDTAPDRSRRSEDIVDHGAAEHLRAGRPEAHDGQGAPQRVVEAGGSGARSTPTMSYSQEKLAYYPPAAGTIPTKFRRNSGEFVKFADRAIQLKENLGGRDTGPSPGKSSPLSKGEGGTGSQHGSQQGSRVATPSGGSVTGDLGAAPSPVASPAAAAPPAPEASPAQ